MFAVLALAASATCGATWWAKSEHVPVDARQVAQDFIRNLEAQRYSQAFEMTVRRGYVGQTSEELQAISSRKLCKTDQRVSTFPFQSNGNRLRRRLSGRKVDMPQVQVEFTGQCLLGVTVRKTAGDTWRVFRFARHAG